MSEVINNELLIAAVERRRSLWLASDRLHKNKNVKAALWREVAEDVLPGAPGRHTLRSCFSRYNCAESVDLVQKRWKSLRDKFRRLYTARQLGRKSGAGADDIEPTDFVWARYEQLLFLRDTMVTRPTSGNYRQQLRKPGPNVVPGASSTPAYQHNSAPEPSETIIKLEEWRLDCATQASLVHEVVTDEPLPSRHESLPSRHE
ncbi:uncharacterized protein LOC144116456 [Amblyomma americanum]